FPEIEFHYLDNGDVSWSEFAATIGLENADGTDAHVVLNDGDPSTVIDGDTSLCFESIEVSVDPTTLSYDGTVDDDATDGTALVNTVDHITDDPHAALVSVTETVTVSSEPPTTTTSTTSTTSTTTPTSTTTTAPPPTTVPEPEPHPGFDDVPSDHLFFEDIIWLATEGITIGCNPPENSLFCPEDSVTRGQMAAFLTRALDLPVAIDDHFDDDDNSVFEDDINRLAESGITFGCNPPVNDGFCPDNTVLRQEMASFLVRGYDLDGADPASDRFSDDDGSVHEADIEALAAAAVTLGCNPPDNTLFCPLEDVLRQQMAAFLHRAETGEDGN
ncbi:MAG: hypothetical protein GEU79_12445, partial [Acidimicrobiia bacterium]|nr:hypothetical protein [Acidimicrobiia bacterium]